MIDFWIGAGLLVLAALAFLLIPVLRGRRAQAEEDRTALNVALYQERLAELDAQREAGTLTEDALQVARAEAARELLEDTEGSERRRSARMGRLVPLLTALAMPLLGYALYLHWGSSDKVELAREFATPPQTLEEMTSRLERAVKMQPDSAEGWYFLGRTYMSQERPADAAQAFEQAVRLAGRQPELLGQWAQALYFAGQRKWTAQLQAVTDEALLADPREVTTLGLRGIAAFEEGRFAEAIAFWERLIALLPADDPSRTAIQGGVAAARVRMGDAAPAPQSVAAAEPSAAPEAAAQASKEIRVNVALDPALREKVQPGDAVFVFARAVSGPPMPLAVKRLTVADLPATVTLSDADAMMPQMRLSRFEQVRLGARISRDGNAVRGEWRAEGEPLQTGTVSEQGVQLIIDRPDAS